LANGATAAGWGETVQPLVQLLKHHDYTTRPTTNTHLHVKELDFLAYTRHITGLEYNQRVYIGLTYTREEFEMTFLHSTTWPLMTSVVHMN